MVMCKAKNVAHIFHVSFISILIIMPNDISIAHCMNFVVGSQLI